LSNNANYDYGCGSTFILAGHLWIVVTPPSKTTNEVIIVNLTSLKRHSDTTTILTPDNHKFIKHDSVISYSDARILSYEEIVNRANNRFIDIRDKLDNDVMAKIQKGLLDSPRTPHDIKSFYSDNFSD